MKILSKKSTIALFAIILMLYLFFCVIFLLPQQIVKADNTTDEITCDNFPDTTNWVVTSNWENGDDIFETYLRFYYSRKYVNSANEEISSHKLYIGSGHIVTVSKVAGKYQLAICAMHKEEQVEQIIILPSSPNSNDTYIDFYVSLEYKENFEWEEDLTFYEFSDDNIKSSRVVGITESAEDLSPGDSSVSYTLTLKNTVPFPTFSSERDFVTDENIGGKYLRIYDGADFEFLIDGFSSVSFILFDDRFCLSLEENNFTYNLVMPLLKGDGYCDIYVPSSSDDLVANINNSDFENPIKDEEFSLYIESGTVRVLNPSSSTGGDNSIDNIKLQINSNSKIKLLFSALLGVGLFMSIFFIANKFFSKRKRIARR